METHDSQCFAVRRPRVVPDMIVRKVSDRMALRAIDGLHPDVVRSVVNYPISHILSIRREFQGGR